MVAAATARAERLARGSRDPLPAGNGRSLARGRIQVIRSGSSDRAPGIVIAAFATLSLGVVLGPEAPLIAIGSGLGVLAVHLIKRDAPLRRVW